MTRTVAGCLTIAAAASLHLAAPRPATADEAAAAEFTAPDSESASLPDPYFLRSGLFTLGASYVPALAVAIESDAQGDENLYVPVAGPWLDLSEREDCDGDCGGENVNKALLVTSGVFQGLGALQIASAFMFPETRTITVSNADGSPKLSVTVTPSSVGRGSGVVAAGKF